LTPAVKPVSQRTVEIRRILDARYSLSLFLEWKRADPAWWDSSRNEVGSGIYGRAMREQRRLEAASDGELDAELDAI
jgi:hypothetical protein